VEVGDQQREPGDGAPAADTAAAVGHKPVRVRGRLVLAPPKPSVPDPGRAPVPVGPPPTVDPPVGSGPDAAIPVAATPVERGADGEGATGAGGRRRVEEISLSRPWVANVSTVLIAIGVLLVLLAIVRVL
jgi:hypothetical protein